MRTTKLVKWGNSAGFRIPSYEVKAANAHIGEEFEIIVNDDGSFNLKPLINPHTGWLEAFNAAADKLTDKEFVRLQNNFDKDEWTW